MLFSLQRIKKHGCRKKWVFESSTVWREEGSRRCAESAKWNEQTGRLLEPALARHLSLSSNGENLAGRLEAITLVQGRQGAFKREKHRCVLSHIAAPPVTGRARI